MGFLVRGGSAIAVAMGVIAVGCGSLLDVDHIEFGPEQASGGNGNTGGSILSAGGGGLGGNPIGSGGSQLPTCDTGVCAPAVPEGFKGPIIVATGDVTVGCDGAWPAIAGDLEFDLNTPAATCTGCTCGTPAGVVCSGSVTLYDSSTCNGINQTIPSGADGQCTLLPGGFSPEGFIAATPTANNGTCSPSQVIPDIHMPAFTSTALLCGGATEGDGCQNDALCVPAPAAPFGADICIYVGGPASCPDSYPNELLVYSGFTDTRACSACDCGPGQGAACDAESTIYAQAGCGGPNTTKPHDGSSCGNIASFGPDAMIFDVFNLDEGTCPIIASQVTGAVNPTGLTTICCAN
jgi:hypothetical protein